MKMQLVWPNTWLEGLLLTLVSLVFLTSGITHFSNTKFYLSIMPPPIPWPLFWVYASAVVELIFLAGLWVPVTRHYAAMGLIAVCILVFPANIYMAYYPERFPNYSVLSLYLRLPLQFVLIYACWLVRKPW